MIEGHVQVNSVDSDYFLEVARGNVSGVSSIHKFGNAPDFDTGDGFVTVWDGANDGGINAMSYTYSTTADIDSISSSNAGDGQVIEVQGLDTDWALTTQNVTLNGQTRVALGTDLIRVFRMKNTGTTNNAGDVYCYVNGAITGGVPNTAGDVRAVIEIGNNQTLMSIYTVPASKTGYLCSFYGGTAGAKKTAVYGFEMFARPSGQVFQLKHKSSMMEDGSSHFQHVYAIPEVFAAKTDIEVRISVITAAVTQAATSAGFDLILVDDL